MAADPCNPLADPQLPAEVVPHHHAVHHVVGRIRHHIHHHVMQAARPVAPVSDACGRPEAVVGQHGGLPALPAGRVPGGGALPGVAAAPKAALLSGGAAKAAAALLGLAGVGALAGTGAALLSPPRSAVIVPAQVTSAQPAPTGLTPVTGGSPFSVPTPPSSNTPGAHPPDTRPTGSTAVPEPSSIAVFALAAAAALAARWRFGAPMRRNSFHKEN